VGIKDGDADGAVVGDVVVGDTVGDLDGELVGLAVGVFEAHTPHDIGQRSIHSSSSHKISSPSVTVLTTSQAPLCSTENLRSLSSQVRIVGDAVGMAVVGIDVGEPEGVEVGSELGDEVGAPLGLSVGEDVGGMQIPQVLRQRA
jgi:hypothetical protein